jgi:hypothetical protein
MRRSHVIAITLIIVAFLFVGGPSLLFSSSIDETVTEEPQEAPELVGLEESDSEFWRFLSPQEEFRERSPINVIVRGEADEILRVMTEQGDSDWMEIDAVEEEVEEEAPDEAENATVLEEEHRHATGLEGGENQSTGILWDEADGTTRYAWIDPGDGGDGHWVTETIQLEEGDYYGQRYHIRAYESPNEDDQWVAMQAHTEHFDWFTLRHRVDGVEAAQSKVEADFMDHPGVDPEQDVRRIYIDNVGPSDADGWATVVDLTAMVALPAGLGLAGRRRRRAGSADGVLEERQPESEPKAEPELAQLTVVDRQRIQAVTDRIEAGHVILVFAILAMFLGVRMGGLLLERRATFLTPHMIAALLYPVIAIGIPVATYLIARGLTSRLDAAIVAAGSLSLAIWLDYGLLGVDVIPLDVVFQRMLVVVALGLIAAGAAKRAVRETTFNDLLLGGVAMWVLVLVGTLFGYL